MPVISIKIFLAYSSVLQEIAKKMSPHKHHQRSQEDSQSNTLLRDFKMLLYLKEGKYVTQTFSRRPVDSIFVAMDFVQNFGLLDKSS